MNLPAFDALGRRWVALDGGFAANSVWLRWTAHSFINVSSARHGFRKLARGLRRSAEPGDGLAARSAPGS